MNTKSMICTCPISKTGSLIFIEIDLIVAKNYRYDSILEQDLIREQIDAVLEVVAANQVAHRRVYG